MKRANVTQAQLAEAVGCSGPMISLILSGKRLPNRSVARGIARELALVPHTAALLLLVCDAHAKGRSLARRRARPARSESR